MTGMLSTCSRNSEVSLYIHVPYCDTRCSYCAFYSLGRQEWDMGPQEPYVKRLLMEIKTTAAWLGRPFHTVFIGGGNPGCLKPEALRSILEEATRHGMPEELTVEMNPESLDKDRMEILGSLATRLSMGVQSLAPETLAILGRNSSRDRTLEGMERALTLHRNVRLDLNFDIITCVPGQNVTSAVADVKEILSAGHGADHISLYNLTIEEGTVLAQKAADRDISPLSEDAQADILQACWDTLKADGYEHYEISNFARPGHRSLHNLCYWSGKQYIGLGAGASGTAISSSGRTTRWTYPADIHRYVAGASGMGYVQEELGKEEIVEEILLTQLRTSSGIDKKSFAVRTGQDFTTLFSPVIASMEPDTYQDTPTHFLVTERGMMILDAIVLDFALQADRSSLS